MQEIFLNNEKYNIEHNGLIRVCVLDGDITINEKSLPHKTLLYFRGGVEISGSGKVRFNLV